MIRYKHLEHQRPKHEKSGHAMAVEACNKLRYFPHGGNIGSNIERIGNQQEKHNTFKNNRGKGSFDVGSKPFSGYPADLCAHGLNCSHQRKSQWHSPEHNEPELSPGLRIGCYSAWIIISNPCNQPRTDP